MKGIEKLKEAFSKIIGFGEFTADALADKKVSIPEGIGMITKGAGVVSVVKDWDKIKAEYKDLDDTERQQLIDHFANELDLDSDKAEYIIEGAFEMLIEIDKFIRNFV